MCIKTFVVKWPNIIYISKGEIAVFFVLFLCLGNSGYLLSRMNTVV